MNKAQLIERYGLEWYEQRKLRNNARSKVCRKERYHNDLEYREAEKARNKERYHNNIEFRETLNAQHKARNKERYVKDGRIDLVENYELALADEFKAWDIHHRLEIHNDYSNTRHDLIMMNLYYNRPPYELIWIRHSEHTWIHHKAKNREYSK